MKKSFLALAAAALLSGPVLAAPAWITVGDDALAVLRRLDAQVETLSSAQVPVLVPEQRGSRTLVTRNDTVHAVQVDDGLLLALSQGVHAELHRCGGFVRHDSMAEALAVLHRLQTPQAPEGVAPSYAIDNVAQVTPLLAQMQSSRILATIQSLSDFQNRYYTSSHGVAA